MHDREDIVRNLFGAGDLTGIVGEPRTGKSMLAIHLAACISSGWPFFGQRVHEGAVVYYTDDRSIYPRLSGWQRLNNVPVHVGKRLLVLHSPPTPEATTQVVDRAMSRTGIPIRAIVLDGIDVRMREVAEIMSATKAHVFYTAQALSGRLRGTTDRYAYSNTILEMSSLWGGLYAATVAKRADGELGHLLTFGIKPVELDTASDGAHERAPGLVEIEYRERLLV